MASYETGAAATAIIALCAPRKALELLVREHRHVEIASEEQDREVDDQGQDDGRQPELPSGRDRPAHLQHERQLNYPVEPAAEHASCSNFAAARKMQVCNSAQAVASYRGAAAPAEAALS